MGRQKNSKPPIIHSLREKRENQKRKPKNCDPKTQAFLASIESKSKELKEVLKAHKEMRKREAIGHYVDVSNGTYKCQILVMPGEDEAEKIQKHLDRRLMIK